MAAFCYYLAWELINIALEYTSVAGVRLPRLFLAVVAVNLLTHPPFMLVLPAVGRGMGALSACELVIFLVEAAVLTAFYGKARWRRVTLAAFVMNATSFGTGLLLGYGSNGGLGR